MELEYDHLEILPDLQNLQTLSGIGINPSSDKGRRMLDKLPKIGEILAQSVAPRGIIKKISTEEAFAVFSFAKEENADDAPLAQILMQGIQGINGINDTYLFALFAFTLGEKISEIIERLMNEKEWVDGYLLDALASLTVERAVNYTEKLCTEKLVNTTNPRPDITINYSPGYCGWHIRSQEALFEQLQPEKIGIKLAARPSYLMHPLKSTSGILISAPPATHLLVTGGHSFCIHCKSRSCVNRRAIITPSGR
ncbi:MAG: hypothetical protein HQK53_00180 [Oligoflexia bacterium]|nr:hypothetical protein [Oligoflexia bacterium]